MSWKEILKEKMESKEEFTIRAQAMANRQNKTIYIYMDEEFKNWNMDDEPPNLPSQGYFTIKPQ
tara:strand:- start:547 stop:738 length:192 start_codon:yes stop_codon:yes gene_type:complete